MEITEEIIEVESFISSKQKGAITENRASEIITLSSNGKLTCYTPNSDDDGIDLIVNPKGKFKPLFIQVKSRFILQKSGQFIQNIGVNTFSSNESFYILFIYFNEQTFEVEKLWLVPSVDFESIANTVKAGETFKSFLRFSASPKSNIDRWAKFAIDKSDLGKKILEIIANL